jgi:uncharacterized membrane protein
MNKRTYKRAIIGIIMGCVLLALANCFILSIKLFFRIFLIFLENPLECIAASVLFLVSLGIYNLLQKDETIQE